MAEEYELVVSNETVVTDTETREYDIAVKDEKIAKIVCRGGLLGNSAKKVIDAEGGYVMVSWEYTCVESADSVNRPAGSILMCILMYIRIS
jgi:hypothetical protein